MFNRLAKYMPALAVFFLLPRVLAGREVSDSLHLSLLRAVFLEGTEAKNISGMTLSEDGWLYFSDDNGPAPPEWRKGNHVLFRLRIDSLLNPQAEAPRLEALDNGCEKGAFARLARDVGKVFKFDLEGVAVAGESSLFVVDERDRLLLEFNLKSRSLSLAAGPDDLFSGREDLARGWINNAFEGITGIGDRLFLAYEMHPSLIVSYKMNGDSLKPGSNIILEDAADINGLDSDRGFLYALSRTPSLVYKIDPESGKTLAVAGFSHIADSSAYRYHNNRDHYRNSEGLVVNGGYILVALDGNGKSILADTRQQAPLVLIFKRPENF